MRRSVVCLKVLLTSSGSKLMEKPGMFTSGLHPCCLGNSVSSDQFCPSVWLGLWDLRCAPICGYRTTLCTTDLHCAPPIRVVHHDAQGWPLVFHYKMAKARYLGFRHNSLLCCKGILMDGQMNGKQGNINRYCWNIIIQIPDSASSWMCIKVIYR